MPQMHVTEASRIQEFLLGALGLLDSAPKRLSFLRVILEIADQRNDGALDALESRSFLYGAVAALDPDAAASLARRHSPFGSARSYRTSPSLHPRRDRVGALKMASRDLLKLIANEAAKLPTDWTPDAVTDLLKGSGDLQKKFLRYLYEQDSVVTSTQIVKALKLQSEVAFAGVLSGLSKRLKKTQLQPGDLYSVTVQWTNEGKIRRFTLSSGFRWAAEQLGWPETWI